MIMYTGWWCNHGDDNEDDKRAMGVGGGGEMGGVLNVPFLDALASLGSMFESQSLSE